MKAIIAGMVAVVLFVLLTNYACVPAYIPNVIATPLLSEKDEIVVSANYGFSGFDPQVAYAVTDQIGIVVNGSFRNSGDDFSTDFYKHAFGEIGAGYFSSIGKYGRFEVYGGAGGGLINAEFDNNLFVSYADVRYARWFMQPTIGMVTDVVEFGFSPRLVLVTMIQDQNRLVEPFLEPAITFKLGYQYVKFVTQFGISFPLTQELLFPYQPFVLSFGMQLRLDPKLFRKEPSVAE